MREKKEKLERSKWSLSLDSSKYQACVLFLQIEVDKKYQNQICGLCGNFDGNPNDLVSEGKRVASRVEPGAAP